MPKKKMGIGWVIAAGMVLIVSFLYLGRRGRTDLEPFAQCLKDKGVVFYGAFWCQHCQNQKALFGTAVGKLPYVECSTPDTSGRTAVCVEKEVKSYPTWVFSDGSRESGELSLEHLAEKTGCVLPAAK